MRTRGCRVSSIALLACLLGMLAPPPVGAQAPRATSPGMPRTFELAALSIHLSQQPGNAAYAPRIVHLSGNGGILIGNGKQRPFPYSASDLVGLLNALYEIRFFDLPTLYSTQDVAQLHADGTVSLINKFTSSASANSVCVAVAAFEKCVRYGPRAPLELERIVQRIVSEAESRSGGL